MRSTNRIRDLALVALAFTAVGAPRAAAQEATLNALGRAWNNELNAARHYEAFSFAAADAGYVKIACLFRAIARAESVHAGNHLIQIDLLRSSTTRKPESVVVRSTPENLERAIAREREEWRVVYPLFAEVAREEFQHDAGWSFRWAGSAEQTHAALFALALEGLRNPDRAGEPLASLVPVARAGPAEPPCPEALVCPCCGSGVPKPPGKGCPTCGTHASKLLDPHCPW